MTEGTRRASLVAAGCHPELVSGSILPMFLHIYELIGLRDKNMQFTSNTRNNTDLKKKTFISTCFSVIALLIAVFAASVAFCDIFPEDITAALPENLEHPYLFFTDEEKPAILQRIKNDPESGDIMAKLLAEANRLIHTPVVAQVPPEGKNTRYYSDGKFEEIYYNYRKWVLQLAFVYQMTGDDRYALKAYEFADVLCDLGTWVIRAHQFPVIYSRVMPWNVTDDQIVFNYDIRTGSMARILGTVYDWLYPALDKRQRDRIRGALLEKAITRVRGNWDYQWWASAYRCNWIGRCADGLGIASLALLTEDPQLADVIAESYNRLGKFYDEIGVDGGWQEGAGYWFGLMHCVYFADALKRLSGGKYNVFEHPRFTANTIAFPLYCYIPPKGMVDFCDAHFPIYTPGRSHVYNKTAEETHSGETAWFRSNIFGPGDDMFDIIWPRSSVKPSLPKEPSRHFRTIDWVLMRSGFTNPDDVVIACKAGLNDDPHHGHLDVGQFAVYWRGQGFVSDLGGGPYDEKYFDEARWDYPHASSSGHNVISVNGELQLPGKLRGKPVNERIGGNVLEFRPGKKRDYVLMDPAGAYPGKELKGWRRHIILEKPHITVVLDEVRSSIGAEIEARFHSECDFVISDDYVILNGEKGSMALLPVTDTPYSFRTGHHAMLPVQKNARFSRIPYYGVVCRAEQNETIIVTLVLPVDNKQDADDVAQSVRSREHSGKYVLSFDYEGEGYSYCFIKEKGGLVLQK